MTQFTIPFNRYDQFINEAAESIVIDDASSFIRQMLIGLAMKWWYGATIKSLVKQVRQLFGLDFAMSVERWLCDLKAKYTAEQAPAATGKSVNDDKGPRSPEASESRAKQTPAHPSDSTSALSSHPPKQDSAESRPAITHEAKAQQGINELGTPLPFSRHPQEPNSKFPGSRLRLSRRERQRLLLRFNHT